MSTASPVTLTDRHLLALAGIVVVLLLGAVTWLRFVVVDRTQRELGIVAVLEPVQQRAADEVGVVVLGSSVDRNALGLSVALSDALSTTDRRVVAAVVGVSGGSVAAFGRTWPDAVWSANPDVLALDSELFLGRPYPFDYSLRARARRLLQPPSAESIDGPRCQARTDGLLDRQLERWDPWLSVEESEKAELRAFVIEAQRRDVAVLWFHAPKSDEWNEATGGRSVQVRRELMASVADLAVGGPLPTGHFELSDYCDWTHLRSPAAERLREIWIPHFLAWLVEEGLL